MTTIIDGSAGITFPDNTVKYGNIPQVTVYTSGSGTYTTPTGAKYLVVQMVGGGGGGAGGGQSSTAGVGTGGGTTTFGASLSAYGGLGAVQPAGGGPSTVPVGGDINVKGSAGGSGIGLPNNIYTQGPPGGASVFGGAGNGGYVDVGVAGTAGSGGGGGGINTTASNAYFGGGGGAGGYLQKTITSPSATYAYAVGAGGTAGTAGTTGYAGGAGGAGLIIVTAYF